MLHQLKVIFIKTVKSLWKNLFVFFEKNENMKFQKSSPEVLLILYPPIAKYTKKILSRIENKKKIKNRSRVEFNQSSCFHLVIKI